ncbi:protein MCM10 homolog [Octopus bimaculoides]|nr:protein MCM10 homolog [Octopus bimaculoides]|eukprot:XP_014777500.1 PREDICTED: protein MCM10 homolog [Octopus bimaculoides]
MMDDHYNLETLVEFLGEDSSEDEEVKDQSTADFSKNCSESHTKSTTLRSNVLGNNQPTPNSDPHSSSQENLLDELQKMRERMQELEQKLQQQNSTPSQPVNSNLPQTNSDPKSHSLFSAEVDLFTSEGQSRHVSCSKTSPSPPSVSVKPSTSLVNNGRESSTLKNELFGDSDSDWEDLEGEKPKLSEEGNEMKKLLKKSANQRIAHSATHDVASLRAKAVKKKSPVQTIINVEKQFNGQSDPKANVFTNTTAANNKCDTDPFSGIRIVNPKVSSSTMKIRMQDRRMIKLSHIHNKNPKELSECDWVTIAVVVQKGEPRKSSKGNTYSIWKLNDLQNCEESVSFFLFSEVYKTHWKLVVGSVIGLLNPNMMDKSERKQSDIAFTISHPNKLMVIGESADMGKCQQRKKNGTPCTNIVNKMQGEFCVYHVTSAYKLTCAKRSELNSYTGVTPKCFTKKVLPKGGMFFYEGKSYTSLPFGNTQQKDKITVNKLQHQQNKLGQARLSTMSLQKISGKDQAILNKLSSDKDQAFLDMLSTPSVGSMNLVKHLLKKEKIAAESGTNVSVVSISPLELLKKHKQQMEMKKTITKLSNPVLGRGLQTGLNINLDCVKPGSSNSSEISKILAVKKIQSSGGLQKEDPNAVRKQNDLKVMEKIKKRISQDLQPLTEEVSASQPPQAKRSKLLGNIDLNSSEIKKLMKLKSSHSGAITEMENEKQENYFNTLEKKEACEVKMQSITEMKCTLFSCKLCSYTALSIGDRCKKERHPVKKHEGMKRFFKCRKCKTRRIAFTLMPKDPCNECGEYNFVKTSMMPEKSGPKLQSEQLSLRGDEAKNLNSLSYNITASIEL